MEQDNHIEAIKNKILESYRHCRACNVCYGSCPLYETSRGFLTKGPSGILSAMYYAISWDLLAGEYGKALRDILYSCTTCGSCNIRCKSSATATPVVQAIEAGRQLLVELMQGPAPIQAKALKSLVRKGNPYDEPPANRLNWLKELDKETKLNYYRIPGEGPVEVLLFEIGRAHV
jgi:Fe-S oxidoreductase